VAMTVEQALDFLRHHQPMPSDLAITPEECKPFIEIIELFQKYPDPRCLPLLINSVSLDTGLGMYEHILFVLMAHDRNDVIPHLREGLRNGSDGVKHRCCYWAGHIDAWELEDEIRPLLHHPEVEVRESAEHFMEMKAEFA
jgi:hypothetical protein